MKKSNKIKPVIDFEGEIWIEVKGYEGKYAISNFGRIKSLSRIKTNGNGSFISQEHLINKQINRYGYEKCIIFQHGKPKTFLIHRLVAIAFINNNDNLPEVNHKDLVRNNNYVDNLEWVSKRENKTHGFIDKNTINSHVGVYYEKRYKSWIVKIWDGNKDNYIKSFASEDEAIEAYKLELVKRGLTNKYA